MKYIHQAIQDTYFLGVLVITVIIACVFMLGKSPHVDAGSLQATPSTLASVFSSAQSGDTILLASGIYSFSGGNKSGMVTIRPANGASVAMSADFSPASNITLDSMTMSSLSISGQSHDIKITNDTFTGQANLDMAGNANANILIDHSTFDGITVCADCHEGRLSVVQYPASNQPTGVTISNNHFGGGGQSDGIQNGANGVVIVDNVFDGVAQLNGYTRHIDSYQGYGQSHTTIDGNYFKNFNNGTAIEIPDGGAGEIITNNVIISTDSTSAIQLGHIQTATIENNIIKDTDLHDYVSGVDNSPNNHISMRNNIMIGGEFQSNGCVSCTTDHNMYSSSGLASGTNTLIGLPSFVGGSSPTTYAGYALTDTSLGHLGGSNNADLGPDFSGTSQGGGGNTTATYHSADLNILIAHYGIKTGMTAATGDLSGDQAVNIFDLGVLLGSYSA